MKQGYLSADTERIVRIRREGDKAWINIKGKMEGITRPEYEYQIPVTDAEELFMLIVHHPVEKIRHRLNVDGTHWEVDEFLGDNRGLMVAEVELKDEDQPYSHPDWLGEEITHDSRYYNFRLAQYPFTTWGKKG